MRLKLLLLSAVALSALTGDASAQTSCSNCVTGTVMYSSSSCCVTIATSDESTLAAWAAKKAVAAQLDWFDEAKVAKLERNEIDALQARVDDLCKWARTLSNHIFASAYADWGANATSRIEDRRRTLDRIDVAKSLVTGLPTPPEARP